MARDDFKIETKRLLATRAGYTCSFPGCHKITAGPSFFNKTKAINTGVAAHITAASKKGPRYDSKLTTEERRSSENGIWMCSYHADLIDKDYTSYTTSEIKKWKEKHEKSIYYRQSGIRTDIGEIIEFSVSNFGCINSSNTIRLEQNNIIYGDNGLGKTLICDLIASIPNYQNDQKWRTKWISGVSKFSIKFVKSDEYEFKINLFDDDRIVYYCNDRKLFKFFPPFYIFYFDSKIHFKKYQYNEELSEDANEKLFEENLNKHFMNYLGIRDSQLFNLVEYMRRSELFFMKDIKVKHDSIKFQMYDDAGYCSFNMLSHGEQNLAIIEIIIAMSNLSAEFNPTLLIIDFELFSSLDKNNLRKLFSILKNKDLKNQLILTYPAIDKRDDWDGYNLINIYEDNRHIKIRNI